MDAWLKRKTEAIFRNVIEEFTGEQIDQVNRWVAIALAKASEKVTLMDAKVFMMQMVRDCPSAAVEMARSVDDVMESIELKEVKPGDKH